MTARTMSLESKSVPPIGALRHRLLLEASTPTADGAGGAELSWSPLAYVWAEIEPRAGREAVGADAVEARVTHAIRLRHRAGLSPAMRFREDTRVFAIRAVLAIGTRRRWLECLCEEIQK